MKTLPHETGQITGVIDVRVSYEYGVERARIEWWILPVAFAQFLQSLKEPAVNQHARFICLDQVFRSGDRADTAPEFNARQ
jgi:hypothetical protein